MTGIEQSSQNLKVALEKIGVEVEISGADTDYGTSMYVSGRLIKRTKGRTFYTDINARISNHACGDKRYAFYTHNLFSVTVYEAFKIAQNMIVSLDKKGEIS